jgi:hypothetical protein
MKFMGVYFTEVSFSVFVMNPIPRRQEPAAFLLQAFNSCRLFAFCERVLFATPYLHARCSVAVAAPISFTIDTGGRVVCRAEMQAQAGSPSVSRQPSRAGDEEWEGIVFLPRSRRGEGRLFFGRMRGPARAYPFLSGEDEIAITPRPDTPRLKALVQSRFTPDEWLVRESATHGKSKTYKRSGVVAGS